MLYNSFDTLWPLNLILLIQTNILSSVKFLQLTVVFDEWKGTSTQGMVRGTQCRQMTDILTEPRLDRRKGQCVCYMGHRTGTAVNGHQKGTLKHPQMWGRQGASLFQEPHSDLKKNSRNKEQSVQFSCSVMSNSATPWTTARQASLSITNSQSPPKPMPIESVMSSNRLTLCYPLLLLPSIFPSIRVFSNESALRIRWPKYWSFSFNISPSNEHPGLISFRMDWLDLLAVQGTVKSLLQHHSSKASILQCCFLYSSTLTSIHDYWKNKNQWTHWSHRRCSMKLLLYGSQGQENYFHCGH